ncbi:hypothetical protein OEZ85_006197 [Tetradesmus obliquus]|uniref:General transcription factor IIH subunit n=1 Tax=Tetradesmus obliquus TaxID=3088 RepID=A0ABY8TTU3_TETOB|nr:hypothetical protein OEZ85_006197 [Tetradesmus obliquus]
MSAAAASGGPDELVDHGEPIDEDEDDNGRSFEAFERQYATDNSWESLQEDERGFLRPLDATAELRARRQRAMSAAQSARIRKGMIRYVLLVLDLSRAAAASDMRPSRLAVMAGAARAFIRRFFDLNPLGQLGLAVLRGGVALRLTELSGSPEAQVAQLAQYGMDTGGDCSLQNALELGLEMMAGVPPYGARELLLLVAALSSVDPGRVQDSIAACKDAKVRVSIVGVSAEVHVLRRATEATGGTYGVALNEAHLSELLLAHAPPPPAPPGQLGAELVRMGFPQRAGGDASSTVFCGELPVLGAGAYTCPRCRARTQELPCKCHVCGLPLISSPHLARSYHHLFPVAAFEEVSDKQLQQLAAAAADGASSSGGDGSSSAVPWYEPGDTAAGAAAAEGALDGAAGAQRGLYCYGCLKPLMGCSSSEAGVPVAAQQQSSIVLRCKQCRHLFCYDCDAFVHESLHNCPGCECGAGAAGQEAAKAQAAAAAAAVGPAAGGGGGSSGAANGVAAGS